MRELTDYEANKWGTRYEFKAPAFLAYGDEGGEDYDAFVKAQRASIAYDVSLAEDIQALILDIYYDNIEWLIEEDYAEEYDLVLPNVEMLERKFFQLKRESDLDPVTLRFMALDWAVDWGDERKEEIQKQRDIKRLAHKLEKLTKDTKSYPEPCWCNRTGCGGNGQCGCGAV
jgi:hypothetical protein